MRRHVIFLLLLIAASNASAGARGYTALMIDIGSQNFFETKTYIAKRDGEFEPTPQWTNCWQHRATGLERIGLVIRKKLPEGVTQELASAIWAGDKAAMARAQKLMRSSPASDGTEIDGMYVLKADGGVVSIMGLGARPPINAKNPSHKVTIPWSDAEPAESALALDLALCRASKPLDFGFDP